MSAWPSTYSGEENKLASMLYNELWYRHFYEQTINPKQITRYLKVSKAQTVLRSLFCTKNMTGIKHMSKIYSTCSLKNQTYLKSICLPKNSANLHCTMCQAHSVWQRRYNCVQRNVNFLMVWQKKERTSTAQTRLSLFFHARFAYMMVRQYSNATDAFCVCFSSDEAFSNLIVRNRCTDCYPYAWRFIQKSYQTIGFDKNYGKQIAVRLIKREKIEKDVFLMSIFKKKLPYFSVFCCTVNKNATFQISFAVMGLILHNFSKTVVRSTVK